MRYALLLAAMLWVTPVAAAEVVIYDEIVDSGGLVCDSIKDVQAFITLMEAGETLQGAQQTVKGCGFVQAPVVLKVTAVDTYEVGDKEFLLVRYDFKEGVIRTQFGVLKSRQLTKS